MSAQARIFECIPNISEGRNQTTIDRCAAAIEESGALLAHRTSDASHNRSVFTFFGDAETVLAAAVALADIAFSSIDLRTHRGEHPRIGALDVLPFVPFGGATNVDAVVVAREAAQRIWHRCGVPSYFYGAAATSEARATLPQLRRGGFEGLVARGHTTGPPDVGDLDVHPRAGAIAVGVRAPLIAFNFNLASDDIALARDIARRIRERDGGLRTLRAIAIALDSGEVQVSCNFTDPEALDLDVVYDRVAELASVSGVTIARSELIGLVPRASLARVVARTFG